MNKKILEELRKELKKARSRWRVAVVDDSIDLVEQLDSYGEELPKDPTKAEEMLLNGAKDWRAYSYGGLCLISDFDIALHYCTNSEFKRVRLKDGSIRQKANASENWLDVQARALFQACELIKEIIRKEDK